MSKEAKQQYLTGLTGQEEWSDEPSEQVLDQAIERAEAEYDKKLELLASSSVSFRCSSVLIEQ